MGMPSKSAKRWMLVALAAMMLAACESTYVDQAPEDAVKADARSPQLPRGGFVHPKFGYSVIPLPGSKILVPQVEGGAELLVESPRGYFVTIEGRPIVKGRGVRDIAADMEAEFLGAGTDKRWNRKLGYRSYTINGLNAYDVLYEGPETQDRLVVMRGRKRDYMIMFFAPTKRYGRLAHEFDFFLDSFRLPNSGFVGNSSKGKSQEVDEGVNQTEKASRPATELVPYPDQELGYAVSYPNNWLAKRNGPYSIVFSGPENSPAYFATVVIQNVKPKGKRAGAESVLASLTRQLRTGAKKVKFSDVTDFLQGKIAGFDGGKQFTADFVHNNQAFRQWTIVLPRQDSSVVHVLSYSSPVEQFDRYMKTAGSIINSWRIVIN